MSSLHTQSEKKLLLLLCAAGHRGEDLGRELMSHGHTVFLSDADSDIEFFGDVVDAIIDVRPIDRGQAAVLCTIIDGEEPSRDALKDAAIMPLPASSQQLADFENQLKNVAH